MSWPFVGRVAEQRQLRSALAHRGAVVIGAAGAGASALVHRGVPAPTARIVATPAAATIAGWGAASIVDQPWRPDEGPTPINTALRSRHRGPGEPVVVVENIDDLDHETLAVLLHLVGTGAIRLVATRRATVSPPPAISALWRDLGLARIDLAPLTEDEVHELLRAAVGGTIDGRAASTLTTLGAGNPLLLRELVTSARQTGLLVETEGLWHLLADPVPTPELEDLAAMELTALDPAELDAVEILSYAGSLPLSLAAAIVEPEVLESLERAGVVRVDRSAAIALTSPVVSEVVRRRLPAVGRSRLAARLARAAATVDHEEAVATGLEVRRVTWMLDAGLEVDAQRLLSAARDAVEAGDPLLAERLAICSAHANPSTEAVLLASWCADERGDLQQAEAVLHAHRPATDEARIALAIRQAEQAYWSRRDPKAARRILTEAAAAVTDPWPLAAAAQQCVFDGLDGRAADVLEQALPLVEHPEPLVGSTAALAATFSLVAVDRADEAKELASAALDRLAGPVPALFIDPGVHIIGLGFAQLGGGDLVAADELTAEVYRHALGRPGRQAQGWAAMLRAHVLAARGRPAAAVEAAAEAELVWARAGLDGPARWSATIAALAHAELGDGDELAAALARIDGYDPIPFRLFEPEALRARAWLAHLREEPAGEHFAAAAQLARSTGRHAMTAAAAHDLIRIGDPAAAVDLFTAIPIGGRVTVARRNLAAAAQANDGAALLQVAKEFDALGAEGWATEARALGAAHLPAQAAAIGRDAARFSARTGLATPPLRRLVERPSDRALTAREAEVVELAASGLTNRAIADQLVVSLRTVENHLHRAFAKLGVTSRSELAG